MAIFIFIFLIFLNALYSFLKKESKLLGIITIIFFGIVFVFADCKSGDRLEYSTFYNSVNSFSENQFEFGYVAINYIFKMTGLSFRWYLAFQYAICTFFISYTARKFCSNKNRIICLYGLYLIFYCAISIRFFFAMSIVVFGF